MSLFSDNIEDDFDDFDDLQQELSKPKKDPLPPLSSNQSKGVLPLVSKQPKKQESSFPSISKPMNKDSFPSLSKKPSNTKFPLANKNEVVNDLEDDQYEFDDFQNDEFENTTNKFAANLDQKTKQFEQMNKNIQSLETSIHKLPKKESKKSSRAGTGMIGDDDDDDDFQEFGESGNNFGVKQSQPQVQKPIIDSKPKLSIKPKPSASKEFNKDSNSSNLNSRMNIKKQDIDFGGDQFKNINVAKLPQQKRELPPKFQPSKKKPIFLNDQIDEKPKKVITKSANSRSSKQMLRKTEISEPDLFQKKPMLKQKTESASILLPIHRKLNSKKAKKDLKSIRQNKFQKNFQLSPLSNHAYPTKVNNSNINLHVEHTIQIARDKLMKMEAAQKQLLNSEDGQDEQKLYNYYEKQNKSLRMQLKGLNGSLNKLIQAFDANTYMAKQKRETRSFSQRPTSKHRLQIQQDQAKNNEKILLNVQREHTKLTKRLQEVQSVEYTMNLQDKIEEQTKYIKQYKVEMKKITNSQRELEKKMDGFIDNDDQQCVVKVQDLTNQLTVLKNRVQKKNKQLQRSADVMQNFQKHNNQVLKTYHKMVKIAQHYEIDVESVFQQTGQASTIASSLPSAAKNKKISNKQIYQKLQKKLKSVEHDYEASKLKNKINDMKKTKRTLVSRKQQLQLEYFSKVELNVVSHQLLHDLIKKFKSTGDSSTIRIVEKWQNMNKELLVPKETSTKMMRANPATGIDRKTPHVIKGGSVVIQSKPLRASGNNKGIINNYEGAGGDPRRGPPNRSLLSGVENMVQEDIMMQTDLSAITKKVNNNIVSDYDVNQILTPRESQDQPVKSNNISGKAASGMSSKPFVIKKGQFQKHEEKKIEKKKEAVLDQDIPDQVIVSPVDDDDNQGFSNFKNNFKDQKKEQEEEENQEDTVQEEMPSASNKPSFASKPFGKPFGKNNKGKPNLKPNFNLGIQSSSQQQLQPKTTNEQPKNEFKLSKKQQQEQIPFSQQFGIKQDNEVKNKRNSPAPISSDPFAKFDNYDPLQKYNNKGELNNNNTQSSNKKTHNFLNDSSRELSKRNQAPIEKKNDFGNINNNNNFQLRNKNQDKQQYQSEFDDLDFQNTQRKATQQQNDDPLAFLNKNDTKEEKKPIDNWPEVQEPTKKELPPSNNNNNNQELDFEDLDF